MKKNIIALAIASAFIAPAAMAEAPTVYGSLNLNINATDDKDASVNSTVSRIGVKGSEDLGDGLKAVYKVEWEMTDVADNDGKTPFSARNQYLGLAGGFGMVMMGRHDTPFKMSQPSDLFNDGAADLGKFAGDVAVKGGEVRSGDVLAYASPSFSGVKIVAAQVMGADEADTDDATSIAVMYGSTKKGLYAAAAYNFGGMYDDQEEMRISAQYKADGLTANIMHQTDANGTGDTLSNTQINLGYKMGKMMPKLKYSTADVNGDQESGFAVGLNYSLGKKTTAYIYTVAAEDLGVTDATIIGMNHKF